MEKAWEPSQEVAEFKVFLLNFAIWAGSEGRKEGRKKRRRQKKGGRRRRRRRIVRAHT